MISVTEARKIIEENISSLQPVKMPLLAGAGKILGADIYASIDIPAFPQSSMDGYAFAFEDWEQQQAFAIEGEVEAGSNRSINISRGKAVRIFTGAPVPPGADTVVMQEKVSVLNNQMVIEDNLIEKGINIRPKGSEVRAGDLALANGTLLSPAAIGFLAGIGITEILAIPNPVISIIITGNELQSPGSPLVAGKVYDSNSFSLIAALNQYHFDSVKIFRSNDDLKEVTRFMEEALEESDVVLLTGGISVGDYDFVFQATENCGVQKLFHKIKQRPGKPLFFGSKNNRLVFGLPGNPSSVLTCFYEYVLPALELLTLQPLKLKMLHAPLSHSFTKKTVLTNFLKGFYNGSDVQILDAQESYRLSSFAKANCFIVLPEETMQCAKGDSMEIHLLSY
jgi:molybdopterin molybdotransferase